MRTCDMCRHDARGEIPATHTTGRRAYCDEHTAYFQRLASLTEPLYELFRRVRRTTVVFNPITSP